MTSSSCINWLLYRLHITGFAKNPFLSFCSLKRWSTWNDGDTVSKCSVYVTMVGSCYEYNGQFRFDVTTTLCKVAS